MHRGCELARLTSTISIISAFVGTGKTCAAEDYVKAHPMTAMIEGMPTLRQRGVADALIKQLGGIGQARTVEQQFEWIIDKLKDSNGLIIVDEAEKLTDKLLEILRRVHDRSGVGLVLLGTENLTGIIKPHHGHFDQIRSRVGFWPEVIEAVNEADGRLMIESFFPQAGDTVTKELWAYCAGSARTLNRLMRAVQIYQQDNALTKELVSSIAKKVLTLRKPS